MENKQTEVRDQANTIDGQYFYSGDGQRIKKVVPATGETTVFVYDASNKLVAEYSTVVEPPATAKTSYLTNDHLGSPRITTDQFGQAASRRDFMPFGEEIFRAGYGSDSVKQKFTGYERDNETNLDYAKARMFGYSLGRFTSPDDFLNDTHVLQHSVLVNNVTDGVVTDVISKGGITRKTTLPTGPGTGTAWDSNKDPNDKTNTQLKYFTKRVQQ